MVYWEPLAADRAVGTCAVETWAESPTLSRLATLTRRPHFSGRQRSRARSDTG